MARNDWLSAIEIHPPKWECPAEPFWIAGWIMSDTGRAPVDVRARLDHQSYLGLCGLPRPEIEKERLGRKGPPYAGFCFLITPHANGRLLRLEACDDSGNWKEFNRQGLTIKPGAPQTEPTAIDVESTLFRLLQAHHSHPDRSWVKLADDVVASEHAIPLNSLPNPPFYGALEQPGADAFAKYGQIAVTGWLAHREKRIVHLTAFVDSAVPIALLYGLPRPDVTGIFAELRNATTSRFAGYCVMPGRLPLPACLRIFAELDDGRIELAFAQRFRFQATTGADAGLPRLSRCTFWQSSRALKTAAHRRGGPPSEPEKIRHAKRLTWEKYSNGAPWAASSKVLPDDPVLSSPPPLRVALVTHNLNREGAPLIALEYVRHLAAQPGWSVHIVSPEDGPLHEDFLKAGLSVELVDARALFAASNRQEFDSVIAQLASNSAWSKTDLIVANTMVAFWGIHLARYLQKPSLFYIHESASVRHFFVPFQIPALVPLIEQAFGFATRTIFSATATYEVHARLERQANFRVVPGWIDVDRILAYTASHTVADLRHEYGLPVDAVIFSNVGSVTERKGQRVFVEAIDLLLAARSTRNETTPPLVFLMVGSSPAFYLDLLRHDIARRQLPSVQIIEHVSDAHAFFRLSDIFVCSSFEESLPRVVLEAAAFHLPIVSTDVNGIPEILGPDDAWLVPPGDPARMASAMEAALVSHLAGDTTRADRSHRTVCDRFNASILLDRHVDVAVAAAGLSLVH